ncbi:MAG TPA: PIN domain-containing protein [Saprospiraceae bacterium]|nr:PIN domain-containing protein [Saprospiraceae bacterium]
MLYLTFDSDIWLNSLKESGEENNFIDSLEFWIENGHVKILLPENVIDEWKRNRDKKKQTLVNDWKSFFNRAKKVFSTDVVSVLMTPDKLNERVEEQLKRVEAIFDSYAIKIPITNDYKLKATELAELKKAPFGQKNSIGDAYIFLSITDYISSNNLSNCVFVTNNHTDFSVSDKEKDKIHPDLEPDFTKLKIGYYIDLRRFFYDYSSQLPDASEYRKLKTIKEEDRKLAIAVLNPQTLDNLTGLRDSYIENINHLDLIFKTTSPTKEQVLFALGLIDSDESYKQYFFKKVESSIWFKILKDRGEFNPTNNSVTIQAKEGFQIPFWEPLIYLEKLSLKIKNGQSLELIDEIISIIKDVSQNPADNYKTWYFFIKILTNFPKEKIPLELLNFIPTWINGNSETMIQSSEICENLLPKFLSNEPTADDIEKAELILKHLLSIEKVERTNKSILGFDFESYRSKVYLHYLKEALIDKKLTAKIVAYCSDNIIIDLAENIKTLRIDFPRGINFSLKIQDKDYNCKAEIETENLNITISEKDDAENIIGRGKIEKFESLNDEQVRILVINFLKELGLEYEGHKDNEFDIEILSNALSNGSYYTFSDHTISKLNDRNHHGDKVVEVFSLIFRDLLNDKLKQNAKAGTELLKLFAFESKYRLPFFRRVVLFVIGENWEACKNLFWEIVKDNDPMLLFSNHNFDKDLYELLNKNQILLSQEEIKTLQKIIDLGPQDKREDRDPKYKGYWQFRWYSALRNIVPFKDSYEKLSQAENLTFEHFENSGVKITRWGSVSPLSVEEILQKSNQEIVKFIHSFKPKDRWEKPTIDGLSNSLSAAVKNEPQKFSNEIELYKEVPYIYAYHIANGFREAWKNKKSFNWEKVLNFYKEYVSSEMFITGQFRLENDGWGATSDWVTGSVTNLLTDGMQSDSHAFDLSLLPIAKEILKIIVPRLKPIEDFKQTNMDYPTYSLNSTAGKTIRTLLDYSLRRARNLKPEDKLPKWEQEIKDLLEETFRKGIIDSYILIGWHFQQFYFLDKGWITNKVKEYYKLEDKEWLAFLSGFAFSNPPFNKEFYQLLYPHYERAINNDIQVKGFFNQGIIRHLVAFYFWGFEDFQTDGLLTKLLNKGNHTIILEVVNFVWRQEGYWKRLNRGEAKKFEKIIFTFWSYLAYKYENATSEEEQKVLAGLANLLVFIPELNDTYTDLVLKSSGIIDKHFHSDYLIENLIRLKDRGTPNETAKNIGAILNSIQFGPYFFHVDNKKIIDLVVYLYENGQKQNAEEFCNKMAKQGYEFLISIHNKYKM